MNETTCILYVSTGNECNNELLISIESVRKIYPNIYIKVFSDSKNQITNVNEQIYINTSNDKFLDKVKYISQTQHDNVLFLDTDTILLSSIDDAFILFDQFDMMFCHAPFRKTGFITEDIPNSFSEINTGVIFYKKNDKTQNFLNDWYIKYQDQLVNKSFLGYFNDQTSFMQVLYTYKDLRYYILPSEFNLRVMFPFFIGGQSTIRILHGKGFQLEKAKKIPIQTKYIRIYK